MPRVSLSPPSLSLMSALQKYLPVLPPTVQDMEVPPLFRECFILSGYRPVGLPWRCYVLSLFQIHNETVKVWSHLLAATAVLTRFLFFVVLQAGGVVGVRLQGPEGQGLSVDPCSLPLLLYVTSVVTYLGCSAAVHLLQSHSKPAHYSLFFLDHVALGIYQFGCALALSVYSSEPAWTKSIMGQLHLPTMAFLAWFSCASCCYAKLHFSLGPAHRRMLHVVPMSLASLWAIFPVVQRLCTSHWSSSTAIPLHVLQVVLSLLAAFFFSCPMPEFCSPGRYDILGHSHQLFHVLLSLCALSQQEALLQDFVWQRPGVLRRFGEDHLLMACAGLPAVTLSCSLTAFTLRHQAQ